MSEEGEVIKCSFCEQEFPSKTQLFRHLPLHGVDTKSSKLTKVVLLVGWISKVTEFDDVWVKEQSVAGDRIIDITAYDVENALLQALAQMGQGDKAVIEETDRLKGFSRGGGCSQRASLLFSGEPHSHSLCDTFACNVRPLQEGVTKDEWLAELNSKLPEHICVHESYFLSLQASREFHAETDCTQRRFECLLHLKTIMPPDLAKLPDEPIIRRNRHRVSDITSIDKNGRMDMYYPADNEDGQRRVNFFRKLKSVFKAMAGKHRFHNFVTAGATPAEICTTRKLDRIYHKEIVLIDNEEWVVFSVSGDSLLRGQVRKLLGLALLLCLELLPMEYLDAALDGQHVLDVPAIPGWGVYISECRYAKWEAKFTEYRLDPRRSDPSINNLSLSNWNERLHHHIVKLHRQKGEQWMQDLQQLAPLLMNRYESLKRYWNRPEDVLKEKFEKLFGKFELESPSVQTNVDNLMVVDEQQSSSNAATAGETTSDNEPQLDNQVENSNCTNKAGNKEKRKGLARGGRNKHKLRKGEKSAVETGSDQNSDPEIDQETKKAAPAILNGRANMDAYRARAAGLAFLRIPAELDDTPVVYCRVLQLLREADRSNLWPSSSTGRQMVIETGTLVENGGRGGSFSVGALPRHMPSPRGNELFPGIAIYVDKIVIVFFIANYFFV